MTTILTILAAAYLAIALVFFILGRIATHTMRRFLDGLPPEYLQAEAQRRGKNLSELYRPPLWRTVIFPLIWPWSVVSGARTLNKILKENR